MYSVGEDIQELVEKGEAKYPFFTDRFIGQQIRKDGWLVKNKGLWLFMSPTEKYGVCYNYYSDGFSIPRFVRPLVPKNQPGLVCAVFHDIWCEFRFLPHKQAHDYLDKIMDAYTYIDGKFVKDFNFNRFNRWAIPAGVKLGGPRWKELGLRPEWA